MARYGISVAVYPPVDQNGQVVLSLPVVQAASTSALTSDNLYVEFDGLVIPDTATLVNAINALLAFIEANNDIVTD